MYNKKFSVNSVMEMEQDLEKSLQGIIKVNQFGDITQTVLKQSNKDVLMKLVNVLTGTLKRSSVLLRAAGADIDQLQSDQIRLQSELLVEKDRNMEKKDGELKKMQKTVHDEMKSWADVVGKKVKTAEITPKVIKEAVKSAVVEERGEEDRSHNVMVYGLEETSGEDSADVEKRQLLGLLKELEVPSEGVRSLRIGAVRAGTARPVRLKFVKKEEAAYVLSRGRVLKGSQDYSTVFLGADRTVEERNAHRKLVEEMKKKREENPDRVYFIRGLNICSKLTVTANQTGS